MSVLMCVSFTLVVAKALYLRVNLFTLTSALQLNELPGYDHVGWHVLIYR